MFDDLWKDQKHLERDKLTALESFNAMCKLWQKLKRKKKKLDFFFETRLLKN